MADLLELQRRNAARFDGLVGLVGDRWSAPTPCTEWDVRALVNHLTVEQLWVPPLLDGATIAELGDRFEGDQLGDDPVGRWHGAMQAASAAWGSPGALERTVHLSFGDTPAGEYLVQMVADLGVHGWDLARALGEEPSVDPDTVELVLDAFGEHADMLAASGMFAPSIPAPDGADDQTRLLCLLGREP